ncbi:hypothetical protein CYMTET_29352 [Cymbomonas tetramitiformis]|uniref:Uncharacterized protein n=1 Tax=Cymbomonas tetramitiformis TaxID=36881 RepID=A0AAE0KV85_9CHLO|nr:hypothetical protein CYMTET_29352 [Cymbomonas tetramitiformis]
MVAAMGGCAEDGTVRAAVLHPGGSGETAAQVHGLLTGEPAIGVAAGEHFSIVAAKSGAVYGWGDAASGQMGEKQPRTDSPVRVPMPPPRGSASTDTVHAIKVAAGYQHAIAAVIIKSG